MRYATLSLLLLCWMALGAAAFAGGDPHAIVLVDQQGRSFTLASLHGRPIVMTFVATRCTDACPIADATFLKLQQRLETAKRDAVLLTVTLDPRYDTPFVMARESAALGADPNLWRLASGTPRNVEALMHAFGVVTEPDRNGVPDVHSTLIYVFDRNGRISKRLLLSTNTVPDVLAAIAKADRT